MSESVSPVTDREVADEGMQPFATVRDDISLLFSLKIMLYLAMSSTTGGQSWSDGERSEMPTVVTGTVPATDFALAHTFEALPELRFEVERTITSGSETLMPLLRVWGPSRERVERALTEDPTVEDAELITGAGDEWLFQITWASRVTLLVEMLTPAEATILDAGGRDGQWHFRVLYPDRELLSETHAFCEDHGLSFEVSTIGEFDGGVAGRFGLTTPQYDVLLKAVQLGHFEVPRGTCLKELAEEFGISHQAASERLRRGMNVLLKDVLFLHDTTGQIPVPGGARA